MSELERGAAAPWRDGEPLLVRERDDGTELLDGDRAHDPPGNATVDGGRGEHGRVVDHAVASEQRREDTAQRPRRNRHGYTQAPSGRTGRGARNPSPHAGCDGKSLPGFISPSGSMTRRRRYMKFRS